MYGVGAPKCEGTVGANGAKPRKLFIILGGCLIEILAEPLSVSSSSPLSKLFPKFGAKGRILGSKSLELLREFRISAREEPGWFTVTTGTTFADLRGVNSAGSIALLVLLWFRDLGRKGDAVSPTDGLTCSTDEVEDFLLLISDRELVVDSDFNDF